MCGIELLVSKNAEKQKDLFLKLFNNIKNRGPEDTKLVEKKLGNYQMLMGFQRLKINDTSNLGNQPFIYEDENIFISVMINGEIYNHKEIEKYMKIKVKSHSDCESVLHMLKYYLENKYDLNQMFELLDGVFAGIAIYHQKKSNSLWNIIAFRDRFGVRPLYYGETEESFAYSSELKGLVGLVDNIKQFPPGTFQYHRISESYFGKGSNSFFNCQYPIKELTTVNILNDIRENFEKAVVKRMMSDRPMCCLLSGGLDSSLVACVLAKYSKVPIHTFCVGMKGGEDFKYAKKVADHIKSVHHEIILTEKDFLDALPQVVKVIETYDATTCRASTGQYLVSKYIKENTDFKVVYVGEGADELTGGYMYFHNAPNEKEFDRECKRLLKDIHYFDGKRSDRCISHFGLESRVPFLDKEFTQYYLSIDSKLRFHKLNGGEMNIEKYLLRKAFDIDNYLPNEILWRKKEAFSDGVSSKKRGWYQIIQDHVKEKIGVEFLEMQKKYGYYLMPYNEELYYYRKLFEEHYPECELILPYFWLPRWSGNITEASARVLSVYQE